MTNLNSILSDINKLSNHDKEIIIDAIEEILMFGSCALDVESDIKEHRFSKGRVCPHCGGHDICRYGKSQGKQRYLCHSCKKTFADFTSSPAYNSKKPLEKWLLYAKCMINGYSVRKSAATI